MVITGKSYNLGNEIKFPRDRLQESLNRWITNEKPNNTCINPPNPFSYVF